MGDGRIAIGTSGWSYDHWAGRFYPAGLGRRRWFDHYASRFPTVEVNYSFYRLPSAETVAGWKRRAPTGFGFSVKGSRYITHVRRLVDVEKSVTRFVERVSGLGEHLAAILWQLPPNLAADADLLRGFLAVLPSGFRHAVEFRHPSWLDERIAALLSDLAVAQVAVSSTALPPAMETTAGFVYVRFHGLEGGFAHDYTATELEPWARYLREAAAGGRDGYAYFNNDASAIAPGNAETLTAMVGEPAAAVGGSL